MENVERNKVMKFGNSNHQNEKMPDWIPTFGPDLAPLSRNKVNKEALYLKSFTLLIFYFGIKIPP